MAVCGVESMEIYALAMDAEVDEVVRRGLVAPDCDSPPAYE